MIKRVGESDTIIRTVRSKLFNVHLRDAFNVRGHFGLTYLTSRISSTQRIPVRITQRYLSLVNHYVNFNNLVRIETKQCNSIKTYNSVCVDQRVYYS